MNKIRIENVQESNIDDLILVCSSPWLSNPVHQKGCLLKKKWLRYMIKHYGPCAKIAYYNSKPVAQILYYPEEADPTKTIRRKDIIWISCIYNPSPEAQRLGIGTMLLQSLIKDCLQGKAPLNGKPCKFILAKDFNAGEFLPLPEFYRKKGFTQPPIKEEHEFGDVLYLPISGRYEPGQTRGEYEPLSEDRGKAVIFYSPVCQFSYSFAVKKAKMIRDIVPSLPIEMINEWERPEELIKRKNHELVVNARPIHTFFRGRKAFKEEVKQALFSQ